MEEHYIAGRIDFWPQIIAHIKGQIFRLDTNARNGVLSEMEAHAVFVKVNKLKFFVSVIEFMFGKLNIENEQNLKFYIPHVRTLCEIKIILLYLFTQEKTKQERLAVGSTLLTLKKLINEGATSSLDSIEAARILQDAYNNYLTIFSPVLSMREKKVLESEKGKLENEFRGAGLYYPTVKTMTSVDLKVLCPKTTEIFPGVVNDPYREFGHFSNYVHGNELVAEPYGNEKFWVIAMTEILAMSVIEAVESSELKGEKLSEFTILLDEAKKRGSAMVSAWRENSRKIKEERGIK